LACALGVTATGVLRLCEKLVHAGCGSLLTFRTHLREPFKRELRKRLLARRGERVSVDDIRAMAADVLRGMRTQ
jgi:hypothetical protein